MRRRPSRRDGRGLGAPGSSPFASALMYLPVCGFAAHSFSGAVDFNCDGSIEPDVAANLDPEAPGPANTTDVDAPYEDWHSLVLKGGAIGGNGLAALLPDSTPDDEADSTELQAVADQVAPPPDVTTLAADSVTATSASVHLTVQPHGRDARSRSSTRRAATTTPRARPASPTPAPARTPWRATPRSPA